ncbi:MAG: DUF4424 family protein [Rhodoferax sp.]|nr:DUF4424 family protein [Rhodoferax sp.]
MRHSLIAIALVISAFSAGNSVANDSLARIGAGGVVLLKSQNIQMTQEILEISTQDIRVRYQFRNGSAKDIKATVAFPLPPFGWNAGQSMVDGNVRPMRGFKLIVDGKEVPTKMVRKAVFNNLDVTDKLRKIGLSDTQILETFGDCDVERGCGLTDRQKRQISRIFGKGHANSEWPNWKVDETVYWEQVFPAGRTIEVRHEYKPFAGLTYGAPYQNHHAVDGNIPWAATSESRSDSNKEACLDDGAENAITRRIDAEVRKNASWVNVTLHDVEYILGTARNWKGPILDFRLRLIKDSPDQIISLCFPGKPNKLSPTILEFSHANFVPQDKLIVHFYTVEGTK